jgi:hypothetical protein
MSKLLNQKKFEKFYNFIIFIPLLSFIFGFYIDENSAGMGNYAGDISWIKKNIQIFLENDLREAIFHPELFGNRTPLIYILNKLFNPLFSDFEKYRISTFLFSLLGPIIFYKILRIRYSLIDKKILFLISSLIYLSPYYRTSAYWGLNENYAIFTLFLSFLFLEKFLNEAKNYFKNIFFVAIFSSLTIYFDQKFLIVPIVCFFSIIFSNKTDLKYKIFLILNYLVLSIPFIYLLYRWGGIVPPATQIANPKTITSLTDIKLIYHIHLGYAATLISFYLLPVILFTDKNIIRKIKYMFLTKKTYLLIFLFFLFNFLNFLFFDFEKFTVTDYWVGLGIIHKLSIILFNDIFLQEIFTYCFFFFSFIVLLFFFYQSKFDALVITYFLLISLLLWPLMQEYFDPLIIILAFAIFKSVNNFNKINSFFIFSYLLIFLLIANYHYS